MDQPLTGRGGAAVHPVAGWAAVTLTAGGSSFTFIPDLSMVGVSLVWRGHAVVSPHRPLADYAHGGHTLGVPLLHPWANRLGSDRVEVVDPLTGAVTVVDLGAAAPMPTVGRDDDGLALHGTMAAQSGWVVQSLDTGSGYAVATATYDLAADPVQMACFPFPHELAVTHHLTDDGDHAVVRTTVTVRASGDVSVPLCGGWHPYVQLPGSPRATWRVHLPEIDQLVVGADMLPTGVVERRPADHGQLGERHIDDGYRFVDGGDGAVGRTLAVSDDQVEVAMEAGPGYSHAQVYAPGNADVVALEPMAAATDALRTGDHAWVHPGAAASLWFTLRVGPSSPGP
jgi:aldose 1-epimerase